METAEHLEAVQKVVRKLTGLMHPLWGWVASLLAIFFATLATDIIRIGCLVAGGGFAIYAFHNTKLISKKWKITGCAVPVVAIACVGLFFGARYFDSDPTTSRSLPTQVQTQESPKARQEKDPDAITLHDLFQTDFDSVQQKSSGAVFVDDAKKIRVEYAILTELNLRTKFLTFYIPSQQKTAEIGAYLAEQYNFILEKAPQLLVEQKNPGDSSTVSTKEAVFSNRIFVYHETYLPPEKTVELTKIYREHGVSVIFRSVDYLATKKLETKVRMMGVAPNVAQPSNTITQSGRSNIAQIGSGNQAVINEAPPMRTLTDPQKASIDSFLANLPAGITIDVKTLTSVEAQQYAQQFNVLLTKHKRRTSPHVAIGAGWPVMPIGVFVITHSDDDSASLYRDAFVREMVKSGIHAQAANGPWVSPRTMFLVIGIRQEEARRQ